MARHAIGPGKLAEQAVDAVPVALDVGITLGVGTLEIGMCDQSRSSMTWPGDEDDVEIIVFDHSVQMHIQKVEPGCGSPMSEKPRLDVGLHQRPLEQRIVAK